MSAHAPLDGEQWSVTLEGRPANANDRKHWAVKARETQAAREAAGWRARAARIPRLAAIEVDVVQTYPANEVPPDPGNCYPTVKAMLDGLVDAGVIPDDGPQYLRRLTFRAPEWTQAVPGPSVTLLVRAADPGPPPPVARKPRGVRDRRAETRVPPRSAR